VQHESNCETALVRAVVTLGVLVAVCEASADL